MKRLKKMGVLILITVFVVQSIFAAGQTEKGDAEIFPSKAIEIVTHSGPGGGTDIFARLVASLVTKNEGIDVMVTNKQGGRAQATLEYMVRKPNDGYTVMALLPLMAYTIIGGASPVEMDQIVPIALGGIETNILAVRGDSPYKNVTDLINAGKDKMLKFGGTQIGGGDHIATFLFAKRTGIKQPSFVPFKDGSEAIVSLIGKNIEATVTNLSEVDSYISSGDIRVLAVFSKERLKVLPNVPTAIELGINVESAVVRGFGVLKGVPEDRIETLEKIFIKAMNDPRYIEYLKASGMDPITSVNGREEFTHQMFTIYENSIEILADLGLI